MAADEPSIRVPPAVREAILKVDGVCLGSMFALCFPPTFTFQNLHTRTHVHPSDREEAGRAFLFSHLPSSSLLDVRGGAGSFRIILNYFMKNA